MTPNQFRKLALKLPEASEQSHMGHPDFRVGGKIFASVCPEDRWGMVKLTPEAQASFVASYPKAFAPASGAWGRSGCTIVQLREVTAAIMAPAIIAAWRNTAPPKLVAEYDEG